MAHETLRRDEHIEGSSNRAFGFVFAVFFLVVALWPLWSGAAVRGWSLAVAGVFALLAVLAPKVLAPLNKLWLQFGLLLGRIVSPISLGILFFLFFVPIGILFRAMGKDPLRLKRPVDATTYWVERKPPGPEPDSLKNQF